MFAHWSNIRKNIQKLSWNWKKKIFQKTANKLEKNWVWDKKKCQNCVKKLVTPCAIFCLHIPKQFFSDAVSKKKSSKVFGHLRRQGQKFNIFLLSTTYIYYLYTWLCFQYFSPNFLSKLSLMTHITACNLCNNGVQKYVALSKYYSKWGLANTIYMFLD